MSNKDLKKRTIGEKFWLVRTSRGLTQAKCSKWFGMSERAYNHVERDIRNTTCKPPRHKPTKGQLCALARRRDGRPLRKLAKALGTSHVTLLLWERTSHPALVKAWERLGYQF